jgi:hypothetical protein
MPDGWTQLSDKFRRVLATTGDRGSVGPVSVLIAWNNVAFDGNCLYAHGGGHADYGGNEVYRFCLNKPTWERLNEPSPYPQRNVSPQADNAARCPYPVSGPSSTHTYDGKVWSSALKRLLVFATGIGFCPSGLGERAGDGRVWAFDPETRAWKDLGPSPIGRLLATVELPNGNILLVNAVAEMIFDPRTMAVVSKQEGYPDEGDGSAVYDGKRNRVWLVNRASTAFLQLTPDYKLGRGRAKVLPKAYGQPGTYGGVGFDGSSAVDPVSGRLIRWGGKKHVVTYVPETDTWRAQDFATGPNSSGALYDRMFPVQGYPGVFVAVSNNVDEGVWLFKLPKGEGAAVPSTPLQTQFDGGARSFTPGLYNLGLVVHDVAGGGTIRLNMAGVRITQATQGKGAVVVHASQPVVIENLDVCGLRGGGNVAAIRAEGTFDLTVRKLHSCDNEMGLLTDNKGGRLVIEDSLIERNGRPDADLGHQLYVGEIDELIVRNSTLRCALNRGHVLKSRARKMLIENSVLAQVDCPSSRLVDASAGGENRIVGNVFQQGPHTDNAEMLAFGIELINKQWDLQSSTIERNLFISDVHERPAQSVVSPLKCRTEEKPDNRGVVTPAHKVTFRFNKLVSSNGRELKMDPKIYCPTATVSDNKEFFNRASAGLEPFPAIPKSP